MIAGRYTLEREIGRGGMGAVWLGRDQVLHRDVALKRIGLAPGSEAADLERAEREGRLAARLNHPHVVAVYDLVDEDGVQWLVMEHVEGSSLAQRIREGGPLSPEQAAQVLWQTADALAAAHAAGVVHRDVKPSNILLGGDGQAKLTDFGIARAEADASLTQTGLVTGSPAYLSPEVASGQTATAAADVWSLGATLFHALAGRPPYDVGDNVLGAMYRIVNDPPPRLDDAGRLAPLLEHTMTTDPAQRWSMAQVRDFLADARSASTAPVEPVPTAAPQPTTRTEVQPPVQPTATTAVPPVPPAVPPAAAPAPEPSGSRRPSPLVWVLGAAAVVLVALLGFALSQRGGDAEVPSTAPTSTSSSPTPSPSSSGSPSPTAPDPAAMEAFVTDYLATATSDPRASFERLTPEFQVESNGYGGYEGFWSTIRSAKARSIEADPQAMTVSYDVDYQTVNGPRRDSVRLQLVAQGDTFLIAGEG